jgi:phosphosulfolactate phosphohydrolase-like enzyme
VIVQIRRRAWVIPAAVVVCDVTRAFTAAAWAFARGADRIVLTEAQLSELAGLVVAAGLLNHDVHAVEGLMTAIWDTSAASWSSS